ncbi:MAG: hypothetical protein Kow00121_37340 [Elainellaceae cyanobacterium]
MQLYAPADLDQLQRDLPYLMKATEWVRSFLAKPHPSLGRSGPVCPFLPRALQLDSIQLATIHTKGVDQQAIEDIVKHYRNIFLELEPQNGELAIYKSLLLIFPDVSEAEAPVLIDGIQQKLKPFFVEEGLMIGEFHQGSNSPGLHNPNFYPLRSPVPMLAIRFMTEADLPFLQKVTDQPHLRIKYLEAYLQRLSTVIVDKTKLAKAQEALAQARLEQVGILPQPEQPHQSQPEQPKRSQSARKCPFARLAQVFG